MGTEGGERGLGESRAGPGGCAGTRLTAVPCPSAPTLPVTTPQPGGVPGGHCHPALPRALSSCLGPTLSVQKCNIHRAEGQRAGHG